MVSQIKLASRSLAALPRWLKMVIGVQSLLPGVVLLYQIKYLAASSAVMTQQVGLLHQLQGVPAQQSQALVKGFVSLLLADHEVGAVFGALFKLNCGLAVVGVVVLMLMGGGLRARIAPPEAAADALSAA